MKETLIMLMKEQHISKISVKKICEVADVNRSTFYAYYTDPYNLLNQIEKEKIREINEFILSESWGPDTKYESLCIMLEYAAQNADVFQILIDEKSESSFRNEMIRLVKKLTLIENLLGDKVNERMEDFTHLFLVTGTLSTIEKWLKDGMIESISEMALLITNLTNTSI